MAHKFHPLVRGRDMIMMSTGNLGTDRETSRFIVYKKGRKLPPKSFHHPPVVGIGGYKRAFIGVQKGGPDRQVLPPHRAPTLILPSTSGVVLGIQVVGVKPPKFGRNRSATKNT